MSVNSTTASVKDGSNAPISESFVESSTSELVNLPSDHVDNVQPVQIGSNSEEPEPPVLGKRKKTCRLKKCPECGLKARSNRQLECSGEGCTHVYRQPKPYKKHKKLQRRPSNIIPGPIDISDTELGPDFTKEELDLFFASLGEDKLECFDDIGADFFERFSAPVSV